MFELTPFGRQHRNAALYNPFHDFDAMEKQFFEGAKEMDFKTDIKDNGDSYLLEAELPGMKKEDINVSVEDSYLTISAERHCDNEEKDDKNNWIRCERSYGSFSRSFDVSAVDTQHIKASYEDGVLKLVLPKLTEAKPTVRRLEIK